MSTECSLQVSAIRKRSHCSQELSFIVFFVRIMGFVAGVSVRWLYSLHSLWVWTALPLHADDPLMECDCETHLYESLQHSKLAPTKTSLPHWITVYDRDTFKLNSTWKIPCSAVTEVGSTLTLTVFHKSINLVVPPFIFNIISPIYPAQWWLSEEGKQEKMKELQSELQGQQERNKERWKWSWSYFS